MRAEDLDAVLSVDKADWRAETPGIREFFGKFDGKVPQALVAELDSLEKRLG
jgi:phosphoenolpyruvate carboxykinase (GTP)